MYYMTRSMEARVLQLNRRNKCTSTKMMTVTMTRKRMSMMNTVELLDVPIARKGFPHHDSSTILSIIVKCAWVHALRVMNSIQ